MIPRAADRLTWAHVSSHSARSLLYKAVGYRCRWRASIGVRTSFFIFFLSAWTVVFVFPAALPEGGDLQRRQRYVNDFAGVILAPYRSKIDDLAAAIERKTSVELVLVTVKSTGPEGIDSYAARLADSWAIGGKGESKGVLFLVAVGNRKVRISVGSGISRLLSDARAKQIIDENIIPPLRNGKYGEGLLSGVEAIYLDLTSQTWY